MVELLFQFVYELPVGRILEPSAGQGALIDALFRHFEYLDITAIELMDTNRQILKEKYQDIIWFESTTNFLELKAPNQYDWIIANPPFTKNQDILHVYHMYDCLAPGGRMVSIVSEHSFISSNKMEMEFQRWLRAIGANIVKLDKGTFKESGTNVGGYIIFLDK